MTDWLSGHEALIKEAQPEDDDMLIFTMAEGKCMARVLREQSELVKLMMMRFDLIGEMEEYFGHYWREMSDDAKELLKQERERGL